MNERHVSESAACPEASFIVPAYNAGAHLAVCLDSILRQTYDSFEIIVVDDGSTDDTAQALAAYRARANVILLRQERAGASAARNRGLDAARGAYVCFIDADDALEPTYLEDMMTVARQTRADVVSSGYTRWAGEKIKGVFPADTWNVRLGEKSVSLMCVPCTRLYRLSFLREQNIRFTPGEQWEDTGFSLLVNLLAHDIVCVPQNNYRYCEHPGSVTHRQRRGDFPVGSLPIQVLTDAFSRLAPRCDPTVLAFCAVKILAGILFQNLRRNPVKTVDAFSSFCARAMRDYFPHAAKNRYISLLRPASLPFIQRAAMRLFVLTWKTGTLRALARAVTRV